MAAAASPALTAWLETLFRERISPSLTLRSADPQRWELGLDGHPARLAFTPRDAAFYVAGADVSYRRWDPGAEGFDSAINGPIPAPGLAAGADPLLRWDERGATLRYDLPGLVHWALARVEEIGQVELDLYGRFGAESSHAHRHGYLERPFIDEWMGIVKQIAQRIWPGLRLQQSQFEVCASHDVDEPSRYAFRSPPAYVRALAGDVLRRRAWRDALRSPVVRWRSAHALHPWDPYNTFDWIMDQSEQRGLRSAFYFICGRTAPDRDADYEPEHPAIRALMRRIHARGHEIGLHPSFGALEDPRVVASEARTLRQVAAEEGIEQSHWGGRMHYLRWSTPSTMRAWSDAGLDYDSTLGYGAAPGFRCGTCHAYGAFDAAKDQALPLRLRPLVAMDATVTSERYLNLGLGQAALDRFLGVRQACEAVRGSFTLLWHNSEMQQAAARWLYLSVLSGAAVDGPPAAAVDTR